MKPVLETSAIAKMLRVKPLFSSLSKEMIDTLAAGTILNDYAAGETIVQQGAPDEGFYLIESGVVNVAVAYSADHAQDIARYGEGDFFGEMALLKNEPSPISVTAVTDVKVLICQGHLITQLIENNTQFALELNFFIDKRETTLHAITGAENGKRDQAAHQEWINMVRKL